MLTRLLALLSMPPTLAPAPEPPPPPGAFLYDDDSAVHEFHITLDAVAIDGLGREAPDVHAVFEYLGMRQDVGLRLKGSSTYRDIHGKPSFKIDFEQWVPNGTLLGIRRLTLNSMVFDPTMMRERVAYKLYELAGVAAPRHAYAKVWVNDEYYGMYSVVETLDEQWLERTHRNDDEGNLYDSTFNTADLTSLGIGNFELEEGETLEPGVDLDQLLDYLNSSGIDATLTDRFDREKVLSMWAVDLVMPNWDGYTRNINNYLLYHATVADRWTFVPWGQDTAFRGDGQVWVGLMGRGVVECHGESACNAELVAQIERVLTLWESADLAGWAEETWTWLQPLCEADPRREKGCDPSEIIDKLYNRPAAVRGSL